MLDSQAIDHQSNYNYDCKSKFPSYEIKIISHYIHIFGREKWGARDKFWKGVTWYAFWIYQLAFEKDDPLSAINIFELDSEFEILEMSRN